MTLKLAKFCDDPQKISTKSSYPQKIFIFLKTPKNIEIQDFEPKKMGRAYVCVKISEYPPWDEMQHNAGSPILIVSICIKESPPEWIQRVELEYFLCLRFSFLLVFQQMAKVKWSTFGTPRVKCLFIFLIFTKIPK